MKTKTETEKQIERLTVVIDRMRARREKEFKISTLNLMAFKKQRLKLIVSS